MREERWIGRPSWRIEDVAVAAHAGVAGPFVARHADEATRLVECGGQTVELLPEPVGYLKVVALVADDIDEGLVAGVAEIAFGRIGADGLATLTMQVAPIAPQRRTRDNAQRIGARQFLAGLGTHPQLNVAGLGRS